MAKSGIEAVLVEGAKREVLIVLRDAINGALGQGKPGRKRGRPKKAAAVASDNGEPKRKRGRPKKVDLVAEPTGSRAEHERVAAGRGEVLAQL